MAVVPRTNVNYLGELKPDSTCLGEKPQGRGREREKDEAEQQHDPDRLAVKDTVACWKRLRFLSDSVLSVSSDRLHY